MIIIGAAGAFGWVIAFLRVPDYLANNVFDFVNSKYAFLLAVNVLLLALGLLASMTSIIVIMTPIILPFLDKFEISYVHFGVLMALNLGIGLITPPVGACCSSAAPSRASRSSACRSPCCPSIS